MQGIKEIKRAVEALLFASDFPLKGKRIANIVGCSPKMVEKIILLLKKEYEETERTFTIKQVNKGFRLYTLPEFAELIRKLKGTRELYFSEAALTTLAVITYRQPITRREVEQIRGVDCSGVIHTLQYAGLLKVVGKGDGFGHPYLYGTTDKFLETFQLESLEYLPGIENENSAFFGEGGSRFQKKDSRITQEGINQD
ncbi:SMC-Scp complex subunit ScpB [candidate division WOR-3 bacterium]|nr:SMC-Scp complex subunit ScpB [candidate division WOR-3 bacterium]